MQILIPFLLVVVVLVNFILSTIILSRGIKNRVNELFGFLSSGVVIWSFAIMAFYFFDLPQGWRRNLIILSHSSAIFISFVFFYFSLNFPNTLIKKRRTVFLTSIPLLVAFYYLFYSDVIIGKVIDGAYEIKPGYFLYALFVTIYFATSYYFLFLQYGRTKNPTKRTQVKFILLGLVPASIVASVTDLVFPFWGIFQYTWVGPVSSLFLVVFIAIAIFKHHLFNIKVIATELLTFGLWILLFGRLLLARTVKDTLVDAVLFIFVVVLGVLLIRGVLKEVRTREELERLAQKLKSANFRLKKLDEAKSEFISIASHQLRAPLTSIKGYSSMLLEGSFGELPKEARIPLKRIFDSSLRLVGLVGDFLNLSRIERGKMEYNFKKINLGELVSDTVDEFKAMNGKNLKIKFETDEREELDVIADENKIRQVFSNIIDNAMKYTPKGFIHIFLYKNPEKKTVIFKVKDSGIGMDSETRSRIFQKFSRAREGISKINTEGLGMGLYIAKRIINDHGGRIWVQSPGEGKGSSFYVELPIRPPRVKSRPAE